MHAVRRTDIDHATRELELEWRVANIPSTAMLRGAFFMMLREEVTRRGLAGIPDLRELLAPSFHSYALYPARDLVRAFALAGALVDPDPREGMRQLFTPNVRYLTSTWYGRYFKKYLAPSPYGALRWIERSREYIGNYGQWRLESRGSNRAILHKYDEYFWFDALRGAAEGMFEMCGVRGEVTVEVDSPFNGRFVFSWE